MAEYLSCMGKTEVPKIFDRWCCLTMLAAWQGRRYFFPFGSKDINSNMYVMLMGNAGSRKTTAIEIATRLIRNAGYTNIAANKTSKEKFLHDLAGEPDFTEATESNILNVNLFGPETGEDAEILISAEEFNIFVGNGNLEFLALLGTLWDYAGTFTNKVKNSKSVGINNPTVTMLAGNTPTSFSLAFPAEAIGQGIFSRLLLIHGERTGEKITWPTRLSEANSIGLIDRLHTIRRSAAGEASRTDLAAHLLDKIYKTNLGINDVRFESYNNRRFTHLIKLCLLVSATHYTNTVTEEHVIYANTILSHAEHNMPKALGEFGKARNSDVSNKLLTVLETSHTPIVSFKELWSHLHTDLEKPDSLRDLIANLRLADKLMEVKGGYISKRKATLGSNSEVNYDLLTDEEKNSILI